MNNKELIESARIGIENAVVMIIQTINAGSSCLTKSILKDLQIAADELSDAHDALQEIEL